MSQLTLSQLLKKSESAKQQRDSSLGAIELVEADVSLALQRGDYAAATAAYEAGLALDSLSSAKRSSFKADLAQARSFHEAVDSAADALHAGQDKLASFEYMSSIALLQY